MLARTTKLEILALGSIMFLSFCAFFWGLNGDSPICIENDEQCFALPALQILINHDPNPHTFINPASTLIYPLVAYYAILEKVTGDKYINRHQLPWLMCAQKIEALVKWPRLANLFLLMPTLVFLYLAGRSWVGRDAAMLGVLFYSLAPLIVYYSQILRADTLANFFICLAMLLLGLVCTKPTDKRLAAALGICAGFATSTRYFCAALLPPIVLIYIISFFDKQDNAHRKAIATSFLLAMSLWIATFFCTSPFVFLDYQQVAKDLAFEVQSQFSGIAGLGPQGNLRYYIMEALPKTLGWMLMAASVVGLAFLLCRINRKTIIYSLLLLVVVTGTCMNPRHWDRWTIPMLPVMCLLAGSAITRCYEIISRLSQRILPANTSHWLSLGLCTAFTVCAFFFPFRNMLCLEKQKGELSGRARTFYFIKEHIPKNSKIACDMCWDWPDRDDYTVLENIWRPDFVPPRPHNYYLPEDLAKEGYQFMIVQRWNREDYTLVEPEKYPREFKFYYRLRCKAPMMFTSYVKPRPKILGEQVEERFTPVEIYDLRPIAVGKYPERDYRPNDDY